MYTFVFSCNYVLCVWSDIDSYAIVTRAISVFQPSNTNISLFSLVQTFSSFMMTFTCCLLIVFSWRDPTCDHFFAIYVHFIRCRNDVMLFIIIFLIICMAQTTINIYTFPLIFSAQFHLV